MKAVNIFAFLLIIVTLAFASCQKELTSKEKSAQTDAANRD